MYTVPKTFAYDTIDTSCVKEDHASPLLLIYGYVERNTMGKTECSSCKVMFGSLEKPFSLDINPEHFTLWLLHFQFVCFKIVGIHISCVRILKTHSYSHNDKYIGLLLSCDMCKTHIIKIVRKALTGFTKILLNDYTTAQSDKYQLQILSNPFSLNV